MHSVEISEEGDARPFLTFWLKGQKVGRAWAARHGLDNRHDTAIYHQGEGNYGWLPGMFPGKECEAWQTHFHLDLPALPQWADFEPYLSEISEALQQAVKGYFNDRSA